ncbi:uncharacterized protein B0H18DRAFT_202220 [Fomitopsis serialis]|uniref:uncharacterized protein n=1 Tax=Fomitopsis serialis TaxID=139415 RepID=UPI002007DEED|nr:uncharacterized protein B0H18DRAFT_202220 [Neoantrodia serialis]KAH9937576.1 hypothetical protein B0H18DRAFT_202220 [Neoantrodia serialis]
MPASEIDDIFAAKPKATVPAASSSTQPPKKSKKKKDKSAKRKREAEDGDDEPQPAKRRVPETVLDPSVTPTPVGPPKSIKAAKLEKLAAGTAVAKKTRSKNKEDEARFKDSRGNGPRRKTEEGFAIFKEDELGISNEGGDTPLCPFDVIAALKLSSELGRCPVHCMEEDGMFSRYPRQCLCIFRCAQYICIP